MSELGEMYRDWRKHKQGMRRRRGKENDKVLDEALELAKEHGLQLSTPTPYHYQLRSGKALWNIYPTGGHIFVDEPHKKNTPYLKLPPRWTVLDVVKAAIALEDEE